MTKRQASKGVVATAALSLALWIAQTYISSVNAQLNEHGTEITQQKQLGSEILRRLERIEKKIDEL